MLIAVGYNVGFQSVRLTGGPDWIMSPDGAYDVEATTGKNAIPDRIQGKARIDIMRQMLQSLLADRFQLKIRRESKEMPVYALIVGKNGPKLQKAKVEESGCVDAEGGPAIGVSCHTSVGRTGPGAARRGRESRDVLGYVENWTDRPIVDRTGISGLFNIQTRGGLPCSRDLRRCRARRARTGPSWRISQPSSAFSSSSV